VSGGTTTPTSYTYGYDTHGSVSLLVNQANGSVKASYGYTPYGDTDATLSKGDTAVNAPFNPYRYTAKRYDSGSQTPDMGVPRFDPSTHPLLQLDQYQGALADLALATDPLTQNRYGLAAGNPLGYVELDGHEPGSWCDTSACTGALQQHQTYNPLVPKGPGNDSSSNLGDPHTY